MSETSLISGQLYPVVSPTVRENEAQSGGTFKSRCLIIALVVYGVASGVIVVLSGLSIFGSIRTIGFTVSMVSGGSLLCVSILWTTYLIYSKQNTAAQVQPNTHQPSASQDSSRISQDADRLLCEQKRKYEEGRTLFYDAIEARMKNIPVASYELPDTQGPSFRESAEEALSYIKERHPPKSIQVFGGSEHACVATDKISTVIFKQERDYPDDMTAYIERADKARKFCEEKNLFLLCVPKCKVLDFNTSVVMEEKVDLLEGHMEAQESYYQWAVNDPKLQAYIKELFKQLIVFICFMNMKDIQYINIPLMKDGRAGLIDLDCRGAVDGLTVGQTRKICGLFTMIPLAWFDECIDDVSKNLKAEDFKKFQEQLLRLKLREKAERRGKRTQAIAEFRDRSPIAVPTQPLFFDKESFKRKNYSPEVVIFAEMTIACINKKITALPNLSLEVARKVSIGTNIHDELFLAVIKHDSLKHKKLWCPEFKKIKEAGLEALVAEGYICSYHISQYHPRFAVHC